MESYHSNYQLFFLLFLLQIQIEYQKKLQQTLQHASLKLYHFLILLYKTNQPIQSMICKLKLINLEPTLPSNIYVICFQKKDIFVFLVFHYLICNRLLRILKEYKNILHRKTKLFLLIYQFLYIHIKKI